jgi:hypothetical protein
MPNKRCGAKKVLDDGSEVECGLRPGHADLNHKSGDDEWEAHIIFGLSDDHR